MNEAYKKGRLGKDPVEFWYQGELGFFDHYVIPLAKKLRECGVFGVSCDEFLNYAEANRNEWALKGEEIIKGYANRFENETKVASGTKLMRLHMSNAAVDWPKSPNQLVRSPAA